MHAFHALHASHFESPPATPVAPTVPANLSPHKQRPLAATPVLLGFTLTQRRLVFHDPLPVLGPPAEPAPPPHPSPPAAAADALDALFHAAP